MAMPRNSTLSFTRRPWFRSVATFVACLLLVVALDRKWGTVPPAGRFFDPFTGFWQNADPVTMVEPGAIRIGGLSGPVQVEYDVHLIPHIFAGNDPDLYRAVGYITARHRLWQMEFQTHAAAGRLSEVFGPAALDYDRLKRRQGMREAAETTAARWMASDTTAAVIRAFTAGVNSYIQQLDYRDFPIEYKIFDYRPEPWQPVKCAFLLTYMASMLSLGETDLENTLFISPIRPGKFRSLISGFSRRPGSHHPGRYGLEFRCNDSACAGPGACSHANHELPSL
jgi:penicillin G amidase